MAAGGVQPAIVYFANNSVTYTLNSADSNGIAGSAGIVKGGTGTVNLAGPNSFTGGVSINSGVVNISNSASLGNSSGVALNGGVLQMQGNITTSSAVPLAFNGPDVSTGALNNLSDANTYTGAITLNVDSTIGAAAGTLTLTGGINVGSNTLTFNGPGNIAVSSLGISGGGGLTYTGSGTLNLAASNTYSGATQVNSGTLRISGSLGNSAITVGSATLDINNAAALGAGTLRLNNGATIDNVNGGVTILSTINAQTWAGNFTFTGTNSLNLGSGAVTLTTTPTVTVAANTLTVGGAIGGSGFGLVVAGGSPTATLTLAGTNTYTGTTTINSGVLSISADANLGTAPAAALANSISINGGTLQVTAGTAYETPTINVNRGITLGPSGGTINVPTPFTGNFAASETAVTYAGIITGGAGAGNTSLTVTGGTGGINGSTAYYLLELGGQSTYTGNTTISNAAVSFYDNTAITNGPANILPTATVLTLTSNGWFVLNNGTSSQQIAGLIGTDGTGRIGCVNNGAVAPLTIAPTGSNSYTFNGIVGPIAEQGKTGTATTTTLVIGTIPAGGNTGTEILSGPNTYAGGTTLNSGELGIDNGASATASAIGTGSFTIAGGTIDNVEPIGSPGSGIVLATNNPMNWNGSFVYGGTGSLNMGTGAVTLAGNETITANAGNAGTTLAVGGPISLVSTVTTANTLAITGAGNVNLGGAISNGGGTGASLAVATSTSGTLTLGGTNTYSGGTTISSGTLIAGQSASLGTGAVTLSGGTLRILPSPSATISGFGGNGTSFPAGNNTSVSQNGWTVNSNNIGTAPFTATNVLQLTDNNTSEARSAFYNSPIPIGNGSNGFSASFQYQSTGGAAFGALADGFTFTLQNAGPTALGAGGGQLGYGGNTNPAPGGPFTGGSASFQFNIYNAGTIGSAINTNGSVLGETTGANGATSVPFLTTSTPATNGDLVEVQISYTPGSTTLSETISDLTNPATYNPVTINANVNLASLLGSGMAYIGFTGSTGGVQSTQTISNFIVNYPSSGTTTLANNLVLTGGATAAIDIAATAASSTVTMGNLQVNNGNGTTLNVTAVTAPANQFYSLTLGTVSLAGNVTFNVANNTVGGGNALGTLWLGAISDGSAGYGITKAGPGTLVLTAAGTYGGGTTINGGTLLANASATGTSSSTGIGNVAVNSGGSLAGSGSVLPTGSSRTVSVADGGTVFGTAGQTLTINGTLILAANASSSSSIASFAVGNAGDPALISVNSLMAPATGTARVDITNSASLGTGTYDLIGYAAGPAASSPAANFGFTSGVAFVSGDVGTLVLTGSQLDLVVSSGLTWTGAASTNWDTTSGDKNWAIASPAASPYIDGSNVTFGDTNAVNSQTLSSPQTVTVNGTVSPSGVTFQNNSTQYVITGSGSISGTTGLTLNGSQSVTLQNANSFTGPVAVNHGTLILENSAALGSMPNQASMVTVASGASLELQNGVSIGSIPLTISGVGNGAGALTSATIGGSYGGAITLAAPATIAASGSGNSLTLSGGITGTATTGITQTLTIAGAGNTTLSGAIADGTAGGHLGLTMNGTGSSTLTLTAANTYTGPTQVNSGTLRVASGGSLSTSGVTVGGGSGSGTPRLSGSGTIGGPVAISALDSGTAGHLAPSGMANATTNMNLSGGLTLADGASTRTGAVLDFNLVAPTNGDLVTTSNLYLGTNGVLNINPFGSGGELATGYYPLIDFTSLTSSGNSAATWSVNVTGDSGHSYSFVIVGGDQFDLQVTPTTANGSGIWISNSNLVYGATANWSSGLVPDNTAGNYYTATFGGTTPSNGQESSILLENSGNQATNFTVGGLIFTSTSVPYVLGSDGSGSLTLDNGGNGGGPSVVVGSGVTEPTIFANLILGDTVTKSTTFNIAGGSILDISGPISEAASHTGQSLTLAGGGTLQLDATNTYTGATNVTRRHAVDHFHGEHCQHVDLGIARRHIAIGRHDRRAAEHRKHHQRHRQRGSWQLRHDGHGDANRGRDLRRSYLVPDSSSVNATAYSGNTTVGDGMNAASLTATQILQNSLTINAGSTVTIAPSGGGSMSAAPAAADAVAPSAATADSGSNDAAAGSDPLHGHSSRDRVWRDQQHDRPGARKPHRRDRALGGNRSGLGRELVGKPRPGRAAGKRDGVRRFVAAGGRRFQPAHVGFERLGGGSATSASAAFSPSANFAGSPVAVPEPSTLLLAAMAGIALLVIAGRRTVYFIQT